MLVVTCTIIITIAHCYNKTNYGKIPVFKVDVNSEMYYYNSIVRNEYAWKCRYSLKPLTVPKYTYTTVTNYRKEL